LKDKDVLRRCSPTLDCFSGVCFFADFSIKCLRKNLIFTLTQNSFPMAPRKLQIACAGLGRMGKRHALHFLNRTPRAELVAASTPDDDEIQWAKQHLEPYGVRLYKDYDEMLKQEGLQAVVIASVTTVHAEQAIKAIEANLHVLCEKPLSTSVEIVRIPKLFS
jgi:hypothetical protein